MNLSLRAFAALLVVILVSSCGQSGKLYIPGDPSVMATAPTVEESAEDETKDESEEAPAAQ
jgi:predicted small lipoprotein YifL